MSDISVATSQAQTALTSAKSQMGNAKLAAAMKGASATDDKKMEKIDATARDFEAVFITEMLKPMFAMIKVDEEFGGGKGEEVFRDFTLNEYGKNLAKQGGFGIAPAVKAELLRMQEHGKAETPGAAAAIN